MIKHTHPWSLFFAHTALTAHHTHTIISSNSYAIHQAPSCFFSDGNTWVEGPISNASASLIVICTTVNYFPYCVCSRYVYVYLAINPFDLTWLENTFHCQNMGCELINELSEVSTDSILSLSAILNPMNQPPGWFYDSRVGLRKYSLNKHIRVLKRVSILVLSNWAKV